MADCEFYDRSLPFLVDGSVILLSRGAYENVNRAIINMMDMERVKECTQKAGLTAKTESLADSYETYLNRSVYTNAVMLSGGETQRLT